MLYFFKSKSLQSKPIFISLMHTYGVGKFNSILICKHLGFSSNFKTKNLSNNQINTTIKLIEHVNFKIADELIKSKALDAKNKILIKCYRGIRKIKGLPVRGQRTHTNAKTSKKNFLKS
jgi:small subunit ribosomal protein S13